MSDTENVMNRFKPQEQKILSKFCTQNYKKYFIECLNQSDAVSVRNLIDFIQLTQQIGLDWYATKGNGDGFRCAQKDLNEDGDGVLFRFYWTKKHEFYLAVKKSKIEDSDFLSPLNNKPRKEIRGQLQILFSDSDMVEIIQKLRNQEKIYQNREGHLPLDYENNNLEQNRSMTEGNSHEIHPKSEYVNSENVIFYGPPGTGKTREFETLMKNYEEPLDEKILMETIVDVLKNYPEGLRVGEMKQKSPLKEKIQNLSNSDQRIWNVLGSHTVEDCKEVAKTTRYSPLIFYKTKTSDSVWRLTTEALKQYTQQEKQNNHKKRYRFVTFHQSFSYEDFVEGIRPVIEDEKTQTDDKSESKGVIKYYLHNGIFKELCSDAKDDPNHNYAIFIDEINRGNVSKIFGELITLIELDKRTNGSDKNSHWQVYLPYSNELFGVPPNVSIYATMNTADHSLTRLDAALRRRFSFKYFPPNPKLLEGRKVVEGNLSISLKDFLENINNFLKDNLGDTDHCIGHGYLMDVKTFTDFKNIVQGSLFPLVQNYFFDQPEKLKDFFGELVDSSGELEKECLENSDKFCQKCPSNWAKKDK